MADEKTGSEESNSPKPVNPTGAPPNQGGAPVPSPAHPPVSHIMPHDGVVPDDSLPSEPLLTSTAPVSENIASTAKQERRPIPVEPVHTPPPKSPKAVEPPPAPMPSPAKPPVSHIMPHDVIVPTGPILVPPKPPTVNLMPPAPAIKIELSVPPPPMYAQPVVPFENTQPAPMPTVDIKKPAPAPIPHSDDPIEDAVGLVRPQPKSRPPDRVSGGMDKILKDIKLPEKRTYAPIGEKKFAPTVAEQDAKKLDDILSVHITENSVTPPAESTGAPSFPSTIPNQEMFHEAMEIASVHTLKHDLQHVVQEQKMSVVKAVALEQEKRARMETTVEPPRPPSRAPAVIFTTIIFIMLGLGALGGVYYIATIQSAPGAAPSDSALVFAEQTVAFPLTSDAPQSMRTQLSAARGSSGTLGSLLHIIPVVTGFDQFEKDTQRPATLSEFFAALGTEPPENLMRALGDDFFLGIHTVDKNAPILVIKVVSYDRAFDGMLSWERNINGDLSPLFTAVPRLVMGTDGLQIQRPFTDLVMRNYDVRALKDDDGVIQLYYSFPTRDLLIIAESPYTFTEILSRLQAGRRL